MRKTESYVHGQGEASSGYLPLLAFSLHICAFILPDAFCAFFILQPYSLI